jgi:hypothetical protein
MDANSSRSLLSPTRRGPRPCINAPPSWRYLCVAPSTHPHTQSSNASVLTLGRIRLTLRATPPCLLDGHRFARNSREFAAVCTNVGLSSAIVQEAVGFHFACEMFAPCDALNSALLRHEKLFPHPCGLSMRSGPHVVYRPVIHPRIASHFPLPA